MFAGNAFGRGILTAPVAKNTTSDRASSNAVALAMFEEFELFGTSRGFHEWGPFEGLPTHYH